MAGWRRGIGAAPGQVGNRAELRRIGAAVAATVAYIELLQLAGFILCCCGAHFLTAK